MLYYSGYEFLVPLTGVLFVENAVLFVFKADAGEKVGGGETIEWVNYVMRTPAYCTKYVFWYAYAGIDSLIYQIRIPSYSRNIHTILRISPYMFAVLAVFGIICMKTMQAIFNLFHVVSKTVFRMYNLSILFYALSFQKYKVIFKPL